MDIANCEQKAQELLTENPPQSKQSELRLVARQMCRLLRSGQLEKDAPEQDIGIEYLNSRLQIREGEDSPALKTKWNYWIGQMDYLNVDDYSQYKI